MREGLSRRLWLAAVLLAFCVPLFVGLGRTDMENDEAIYSYAVDSILARGDWLNPLSSPHDDAVFLEKPPLKFWLVAAPIRLGLLPHNELGMRVWDALFGAIAFLYVFAIGRRLEGPICGVIAVLVLFAYRPLLFEHGLRNNNMEAPLVLCYCGGVYHYLAWARAEAGRRRLWHALAVMMFFLLGFMTKFVAALFLPVLLAVATLFERSTRTRLFHDWKLWGLGAFVFFLLASPWFIYQQVVVGSYLWHVILGDHVFLRMTAGLDPSHLHPWNYYYRTIFLELESYGTQWLAIAGGVLLLVRAWRERSLEVLLVVSWFAVPLALMSLGSSKLHHYAYPFLPPVALAAGYAPAWLIRVGQPYVNRALAWIEGRLGNGGWRSAGVRNALLAIAGVAVVIAVATLLLGSLDLRIGQTAILRNSHVARPLVVAMILVTLAGRGTLAGRVLLPIGLLLTILPVNYYEDALHRTTIEEHPMRTASDCLVRVRASLLAAGRPAPSIYAIGEQRWMLHSHYYYFRRLGPWERSDTLDERVVERGLFEEGEQRPILTGDPEYQAFKRSHSEALLGLPVVRLHDALLLMPGPYAVCDPTKPVATSP